MVCPIAEVPAAGFTLGVFLRNIPFRASIHAAAGALCMLRGIIALLAGKVLAAGGSGMILAIAGKVAERLAGGGTVILTIAVEMAFLPAGSGAMVACCAHVMLAAGGKGMILAIAQIAAAGRALGMRFFLAVNLAAAMPAGQFLMIAMLLIAPELAALGAGRVAVGAGAGIIIAAAALVGVAIVLRVAHAERMALFAILADHRVMAGSAIIWPAAVGTNVDGFAHSAAHAVFEHAVLIPDIGRAAFLHADFLLRKAAGDDGEGLVSLQFHERL